MDQSSSSTSSRLAISAWILAAVYTVISLVPRVAPELLPSGLVLSLTVLVPLAFAFVHGAVQYRFRDAAVFVVLTLVVSNIFENTSILTGFPFGNYHYTDNLGPMAFLVPVLIGPAYVGTGYLSWTLARLLINDTLNTTLRVVAVPVIASFLMVAWDLTFDPWTSTILGNWIWHDGGNYFGVPFSNFLGWYFTVYVIFQLFALYLRRVTPSQITKPARPAPSLWWSAVAMYAITAAQPLLRFWFQPSHAETATDPSGTTWKAADVYANGALITLFTMGMITVLSILVLTRPRDEHDDVANTAGAVTGRTGAVMRSVEN